MNKTDMLTFADRLQYVIEKNNYSHNDVARLCGVGQGSISYILAKNLDRSKLAYQIAQGLNISYNWLTTGKGTIKSQSVYQIPKFENIFDCIKYTQSQNAELADAFIYTERDELADKAFAIQMEQENYLLVCSFNEKHKGCGLYLNITDIMAGSLQLSRSIEAQAYFAVVEVRIQNLNQNDCLKFAELFS